MTLIEVMVALAILGLALTLTVPMFAGRVETARLLQVSEDVASQVRHAPLRARLTGRALTFSPASTADGAELIPIEIEAGWSIDFNGELTISPLGMCTSGDIAIHTPAGRSRIVRVDAPWCEATVIEAAPT